MREAFDGIKIWGCLFHLSQNVFKKVVELGYKIEYSNDTEFRQLIGWFPALSALPIEVVIKVFEALVDLDIDEKLPAEFISYFENTYIGQKRRSRRLKPMFEIKFWNVRDRILNDQPRTNNAIEGFHSSLCSHVTYSHPSIWKLIDGLKISDHKGRKKITEYDRGDDFDQKELSSKEFLKD